MGTLLEVLIFSSQAKEDDVMNASTSEQQCTTFADEFSCYFGAEDDSIKQDLRNIDIYRLSIVLAYHFS